MTFRAWTDPSKVSDCVLYPDTALRDQALDFLAHAVLGKYCVGPPSTNVLACMIATQLSVMHTLLAKTTSFEVRGHKSTHLSHLLPTTD